MTSSLISRMSPNNLIQFNFETDVQEAYHFLRGNISFYERKKPLKTICVVSHSRSEGKTAVAMNLAISFANCGQKTLFVDSDLRKPVLEKRLGNAEKGLATILFRNEEPTEAIVNAQVENLFYLPCGRDVENTYEMLSSARFKDILDKLSQEYDKIIIDTPALSNVIDGYEIASMTDGAIIVIRNRFPETQRLTNMVKQLKMANVNVIGAVLNKVPMNEYRRKYNRYHDDWQDVKKKRTSAS
ncbi:MAG: CpsD/CapB family tyrosine-protein kinase [Thermoclostridium sp.]|nr:CpsD/CapB family tyrosine-protein kinase [Thermoclostridium sp.]